MYVVNDTSPQGHEIDPRVHQQYVDLFAGAPRSLRVQKKVDRRVGEAAEAGISHNFDRLNDTRALVADRMCGLFSGLLQATTAEILYKQAQEHYRKTILGTMTRAAVLAQKAVGDENGISIGEAAKLGSAHVFRQEATDRIRTINNAFYDTFNQVGSRLPNTKRVTRYLGFVVAYPDRPSHVLLRDSSEHDMPAAEVSYGQTSMNRYLEAFEKSVDINWSNGAEPDLNFFINEALESTLNTCLSVEATATKEALEGVL